MPNKKRVQSPRKQMRLMIRKNRSKFRIQSGLFNIIQHLLVQPMRLFNCQLPRLLSTCMYKRRIRSSSHTPSYTRLRHSRWKMSLQQLKETKSWMTFCSTQRSTLLFTSFNRHLLMASWSITLRCLMMRRAQLRR